MATPRTHTIAAIVGAAWLCFCEAGAASAEPWASPARFAVGVRSTALDLESSKHPEQAISMSGGGLHVRYRATRRFEIELGSERTSGARTAGRLARDSQSGTLGTLIRFRPDRAWDWYLIAGVGRTHSDVEFAKVDGSTGAQSFASTHVHFGLGLERRFGSLAFGIETRAVGLARHQDELDAPTYGGRDGPLPTEESGAQLGFTASYYF